MSPGLPSTLMAAPPLPLACLAASNDLDFPGEFPTETALALHPPEPEVPGPPGNSYENVNHIRIPRSKKPPRPSQAESRGPLQPHPGLVTWLGPHPQLYHQPWWPSPPITSHDADWVLADSGHAQFIWVGSPGSLCARSVPGLGSPRAPLRSTTTTSPQEIEGPSSQAGRLCHQAHPTPRRGEAPEGIG